MGNLIKGFVEIERKRIEIDASREQARRFSESDRINPPFEPRKYYRLFLARMLYTLLQSYPARSLEIHRNNRGFDSAQAYSKLLSQEKTRAYDFLAYHRKQGWNKILKLEELLGNESDLLPVQDYTLKLPAYVDDLCIENPQEYADETDIIQWHRDESAGEKPIILYLLKFLNFNWYSRDGIGVRNGVFFAEKDTCDEDADAVHMHIKDLVARLARITIEKNRAFTAQVKRQGIVERYHFNPKTQEYRWVLPT